MKLTSITDHSDYIDSLELVTNSEKWQLHCLRKEFGKQPLKLGFFIPCDEDDNPLEDPELTLSQGDGFIYYSASDDDFEQYKQAEERVLFEGKWRLTKDNLLNMFSVISNGEEEIAYEDWTFISATTIEELTMTHELTLTPEAIKQLGL